MNTETLVAKLAPKSHNRISANSDDPGYPAYIAELDAGRTVHVYVDGQEVTKAITADPGLGFVTRVVTGEDGLVITDGGSLLIEDIYGVVTWTAEGPHVD